MPHEIEPFGNDPRRRRQFVRQYQIRNNYYGRRQPKDTSLTFALGVILLALAGILYMLVK